MFPKIKNAFVFYKNDVKRKKRFLHIGIEARALSSFGKTNLTVNNFENYQRKTCRSLLYFRLFRQKHAKTHVNRLKESRNENWEESKIHVAPPMFSSFRLLTREERKIHVVLLSPHFLATPLGGGVNALNVRRKLLEILKNSSETKDNELYYYLIASRCLEPSRFPFLWYDEVFNPVSLEFLLLLT